MLDCFRVPITDESGRCRTKGAGSYKSGDLSGDQIRLPRKNKKSTDLLASPSIELKSPNPSAARHDLLSSALLPATGCRP
jgi:hypothetical protein